MNITPAGVAFIRSKEGLKLTAYRDKTGLWTIGYGHTLTAKQSMTITPEEAENLLQSDVGRTVNQVTRILGDTTVTQPQFDALVSFAFNVGSHRFLTSTLLKYLKAGDVQAAADQFAVWNKISGEVSNWQVQRRAEEREIFLNSAYPKSGLTP